MKVVGTCLTSHGEGAICAPNFCIAYNFLLRAVKVKNLRNWLKQNILVLTERDELHALMEEAKLRQ